MLKIIAYYIFRDDVRWFFLIHLFVSLLQAIFEGLFVYHLSNYSFLDLLNGEFLRKGFLLYLLGASVFFRLFLIYSNFQCLSSGSSAVVRSLVTKIYEYDKLELYDQRNLIFNFLKNKTDLLYFQFHQPLTAFLSLVSVFTVVMGVFVATFPAAGAFTLGAVFVLCLLVLNLGRPSASRRSSIIAMELKQFHGSVKDSIDHCDAGGKLAVGQLADVVNSYSSMRKYVSIFQVIGFLPRLAGEVLFFVFLVVIVALNLHIGLSGGIVVVLTYAFVRLAPVLVRGFASISVMYGAKDVVDELKGL